MVETIDNVLQYCHAYPFYMYYLKPLSVDPIRDYATLPETEPRRANWRSSSPRKAIRSHYDIDNVLRARFYVHHHLELRLVHPTRLFYSARNKAIVLSHMYSEYNNYCGLGAKNFVSTVFDSS